VSLVARDGLYSTFDVMLECGRNPVHLFLVGVAWFLRSWKVMESHGILASHGKSWKVMENGESHGKVMEF